MKKALFPASRAVALALLALPPASRAQAACLGTPATYSGNFAVAAPRTQPRPLFREPRPKKSLNFSLAQF